MVNVLIVAVDLGNKNQWPNRLHFGIKIIKLKKGDFLRSGLSYGDKTINKAILILVFQINRCHIEKIFLIFQISLAS